MILSLALIPAVAALQGTPPGPDPVPIPGNILVIVADDIGIDRIGAYAADLGINPSACFDGTTLDNSVSTPFVDQLAADGVLFRNVWSSPTCSPTRASILTGKYGLRTGIGRYIPENPNQNYPGPPELDLTEHSTIANELQLQSNYQTEARGKWHLAQRDAGNGYRTHPLEAGFESYRGSMANIRGSAGFAYDSWMKTVSDPAVGVPTEDLVTTYATVDTTRDAAYFIANANATPWFLYVAYNSAHAPFHSPPGYGGLGLDTEAEETIAMMSHLDTHIGLLINSMTPQVRNNTTIILIGDNGNPEAARCYFEELHNKGTVYEGGVRVPMIIVSPLTPTAQRGAKSDALVCATDVFATIADLANINVEPRDSVSMLPYITDPTMPSIRDHMYTEKFTFDIATEEFSSWDRAVRGPDYKYVRKMSQSLDFTEEFYNVTTDLLEQTDLYEDDDLTVGVEYDEFIRLKAIMDADIPIWDPAVHGVWKDGFQHAGTASIDPCQFPDTNPLWESGGGPGPAFNSVHMSLIPKGQYRGNLLVWDVEGGNATPPPYQRWGIVDVMTDPAQPRFLNYVLAMPDGLGDLFCAGHSWTPDGNLFVAGGTSAYPGGTGNPFIGGRLTYLFEPPATTTVACQWNRQPNLKWERWYPSVMSIEDDELLVLGGRRTNPFVPQDNTFEEYELGPTGLTALYKDWLRGPTSSTPLGYLHYYPRMTLLNTGDFLLSGFTRFTQTLNRSGAFPTWTAQQPSALRREYGTTVHLTNSPALNGEEIVLAIGGKTQGGPNQDPDVHKSIQFVETNDLAGGWKDMPDMFNSRWRANGVALPNGNVFVTGGDRRAFSTLMDQHVDRDPVFNALMVTPSLNGSGMPTAELLLLPGHEGQRSYHSNALLLPDATILMGGGDTRSVDYQIYEPPYLHNGTERPAIQGAPTILNHSSAYSVSHNAMTSTANVQTVVLMHPASVTHHSDQEQRYFAMHLVSTSTSTSADFIVTSDRDELPPGHYMLFLVSSEGTPSEATWVKVE